MDLAELQRHWDAFGRQDPFWAILTDPTRRGNRWPIEEFFETGRAEVDDLLKQAARLGVPREWRTALDFGCGAGRLTQALGHRFDASLGLDVAPSMIDLARAHNRHGLRCAYEVNDQPDLSRWRDEAFDLVYTSRVLQHIEPCYTTDYIREFVRVLAQGGCLSFDLPSTSGDAAALAEGTVPASGMRAHLRVDADDGLRVAAGATTPFRVEVINTSGVTWRQAAAHPINVGNHWLDRDGVVLRYDDARTALPTPIAPGAMAEIEILVTAPIAPGDYRLQFDVVQEGVAWFATCGSMPGEVAVRVGEAEPRPAPASQRAAPLPAPTPRDDPSSFDPVMEMHAVPRHEVEAILAGAGARLLQVRRVHHCGPQWLAFRYDVTK
ncbi:MAG: class I SAM-dependent methyltransferase [Acidobacteriota bacterium]|nr:class I SAM-dependent methyltransferase [Acidobacteriota bacterium]